MDANTIRDGELVDVWTFPYAARLGSSVRSKGLFLEIRALLPRTARTSLTVKAGELVLRMPQNAATAFSEAAAIISRAMGEIERRPVIPREIEDILGISTGERRKWLADGRLRSCGTRTVRLRGRGTITFHVFDPRVVQDLLERNAADDWRADDAEAAAARREALKLGRVRARSKAAGKGPPEGEERDDDRFRLRGWARFEREGLLR